MLCDNGHVKVQYSKYNCAECRKNYLRKFHERNKEKRREKDRNMTVEQRLLKSKRQFKYEYKDRKVILARSRENYQKRKVEGRLVKYKTDPHIRREIKNRYKARKMEVTSVKYNSKSIFEKFNHTCIYCGSEATQLDHVQPISRGGLDIEENLVAACKSCNCSKGNKTLVEWRTL